MPRRFDFISPGVSITEVDQSIIADETQEDGILIIGTAPQGPAGKPVKVTNLEDFYRVFGEPVSGKASPSTDVWRDGNRQATAYGMYAAQSWLASGVSPVTYYRLVGEDQLSSKQASGYTEAGWNTHDQRTNFDVGAATAAHAYGIFLAPSASNGTARTAKLSAIIYSTGSAWALSGNSAATDADPITYPASQSVGCAIASDSNSSTKSTFTLAHSSTVGTDFTGYQNGIERGGKGGGYNHAKSYTVHFDRTKPDGYIRNVLNCNPLKTKSGNYTSTENYFLGETFDEAASRIMTSGALAQTAAGKQTAIMLPLSNNSTHHYSTHQKAATAAKTGWFINRNPSPGDDYSPQGAGKLFRLVSLHEGESFQKNFGVRIENLKLGTTSNPDSTFTVTIINRGGEALESFSGLNLNESSDNYISKKIGDMNQTFNTTLDKYEISGEYANVSDYVRVEVSDELKSNSDAKKLPFGVWGPLRPLKFLISSGSTAVANTFSSAYNFETQVLGHGGQTETHMARYDEGFDYSLTCEWPELQLTDENSNNGGNYTKDYVFGVRHMLDTDNKGKKVLWDSPCYPDIVRALPNDLSMDGEDLAATTEISWIFTIDDIMQDSTDPTKFFYASGSHATDAALTRKSGGTKAPLSGGVRQFNAPFFGGCNGLDIREVEPFAISRGLANANDESKHYAYYSVKKALSIVDDKDLLNFDIISMPGLINTNLNNDVIKVAEERGDCMAIIDIDSGYRKSYDSGTGLEVLGDASVGGSKKIISNAEDRDYNTSYAAAYYPPVRLKDTVSGNNEITIVPPSVAALGAIAFSEANSDGPWFAPAGFNRGGLSTLGGTNGPRVVGAIEHLTKQDRDDLYETNINPIARFPAVGEIVIFGQKTLQQTQSALDRINVRRLMIYLKKKIGKIADTVLFDQNVRATWLRFKAKAERVLGDVQSRFGITEYKLVLDETTTTADLIDRNIMYAKVFIKPARAIEFIAIDFVITKTGIEL